jgi:hypothetical protein
MTEQPTKPRKPKYKYTRELVKIAIADGMSQTEIAALCRTQQSVVHGWAKGKSLAFEHQVIELKKRYAARLNRATSRVYLVGTSPLKMVAVEGPIVLRYSFVRPEEDPRGKAWLRIPIGRWVVHRHGRGRFVLVELSRRPLDEERRARWAQELRRVSRSGYWEEWVDCADDAARWIARIDDPTDAGGLMTRCDEHVRDPARMHNPHDELVLPFLVRKMLVEQGFDVPDLERMMATE